MILFQFRVEEEWLKIFITLFREIRSCAAPLL